MMMASATSSPDDGSSHSLLLLPLLPTTTTTFSSSSDILAAAQPMVSLAPSFRPARGRALNLASAAAGEGLPHTTYAVVSQRRRVGSFRCFAVAAAAFSSPESLSDWLRHRLPSDSFASWGVKPGTKTVHNLWLEMSLGVSRAVREELGGEAKVRIIPETYETRVEGKASSSYPGLPAQYVLHSVDAEVEGVPQEGEFSTEEVGECSEVSSEVFQKAVFVQRHFWKWVHDGMDGDGESTLPLR